MKTHILTALCALSLPVLAEEAPKEVASQLQVLLEATQNNNLEKFQSVCDDTMKAAITAEKLAQVSQQIAPLMKAGYKTDFIGDLDKVAFNTYLWKVDFDQDKAPDMLAEVSVANGKVAGFYIR